MELCQKRHSCLPIYSGCQGEISGKTPAHILVMHAQDDPELAGMFEDIQYVSLAPPLVYSVQHFKMSHLL